MLFIHTSKAMRTLTRALFFSDDDDDQNSNAREYETFK